MNQSAAVDQGVPGFRGEHLTPSSDDYDAARRIFNERLTGHPAVIARCTGVADVQAALRHAVAEDLVISVRSGGHGLAGWASNDGGLVIDLTGLRWVLVDPDTRTAWVGGGARAGDVVAETIGYGLAPVTGVSGGIGLGGLATGAGEGYLTAQHGYASDNVLAVELVTVAGQVLRVSATEHPELFWALRGAGPNFGIVTAMQLRLHPVPEQVVGGGLTFAATDAAAVTRATWDLMEHGSPFSFPQLMYAMGEDGELFVQVMPGHVGPSEVATREIDQLRRSATPIRDDLTAMTYAELLASTPDDLGGRHAWDIHLLPFSGPRDEQIALVLDQAARLAPGSGFFDLWSTRPGGAGMPASALPRESGISLVVAGMWADPSDDDRQLAAFDAVTSALRGSGLTGESPSASNHVSALDPARVAALYGAENYARLRRLKARYDPDHVLRRNFTIPPAA